MYSIKNEHHHTSISERWAALDSYFVCLAECNLNDMSCATVCMVKHLKIEDGSDLEDFSDATI